MPRLDHDLLIFCLPAIGDLHMNDALAFRVNPWLLAAIIAAIVLVSAVILVVSQQGLIHTIGGMLQGPQQMAPWGCSGLPGPC
jgi:hypothetical protein